MSPALSMLGMFGIGVMELIILGAILVVPLIAVVVVIVIASQKKDRRDE